MSSAYLKSPLNYTGGKYKLLTQIFPLFPNDISTFVDLFCGGLNVGINADSPYLIANDNIDYLIELYQYFKNNTSTQIIDDIDDMIERYSLSKTNKEGYDKLRSDYNKKKSPLRLLVLVFYSFNHQIRFNNAHEFNCSFGMNRSSYNPTIKKNLIAFVDRMHEKKMTLLCNDFTSFPYDLLTTDDFLYCDPPYFITTGSYNDGNRGFKNWTHKEQGELFDILDDMDRRGIRFALSNVLKNNGKTDTMLADWSRKYDVHHLEHSYGNASYHKKNRSSADEVLIINY